MYELKKTHGSVMDFVQRNRLMWDSITPSGDVQFTNSADLKVLYNDWPYAVDPDIVHLVVWTKFLLEDDPATNDLTDIARDRIEQFVIRTFCGENGVPRDQLVWFKNWRSLKSIHALGRCSWIANVPQLNLHRALPRHAIQTSSGLPRKHNRWRRIHTDKHERVNTFQFIA